MNIEQKQQGLDVPVRHVEPENEPNEKSPHFQNRESDDSQVIWPDLLLPGMADKQTPPINIPRVQGTPQPGGVPTVQATPATANTPPPWPPHMPHSGHIIQGTPPIPPPPPHPPKPPLH